MSGDSRHNRYANPRRLLTATEEQFSRWDAAARRAGVAWSEWVRNKLDDGARGEFTRAVVASFAVPFDVFNVSDRWLLDPVVLTLRLSTEREMAKAVECSGGVCAYCFELVSGMIREHVASYGVGEEHYDATNIVMACRGCNARKAHRGVLCMLGPHLDSLFPHHRSKGGGPGSPGDSSRAVGANGLA